jgi:starch synthase (maltosyl-transferring)
VGRDFEKTGNLRGYIAALNRIRRENPALQRYEGLRFFTAQNDRVLFYGKQTPNRTNAVWVAVSLDPFAPQEAVLEVPLRELGVAEDEVYQVHELLTDRRALWQGPTAHVRLTPEEPAAIWSVVRLRHTEKEFDYYD